MFIFFNNICSTLNVYTPTMGCKRSLKGLHIFCCVVNKKYRSINKVCLVAEHLPFASVSLSLNPVDCDMWVLKWTCWHGCKTPDFWLYELYHASKVISGTNLTETSEFTGIKLVCIERFLKVNFALKTLINHLANVLSG